MRHLLEHARTIYQHRLEIQLRRPVLRELTRADGRTLDTLSVPETMQALPGFLPYFLLDWLSLRIPNEDKNKWRWPVDPLWLQMVHQATHQQLAGSRQFLQPQFNAPVLARTIMGYLASFALAMHTWDDSFFTTLPDLLAASTEQTPEDVWAMIQTAMEEKSEKYHITRPF